MMNWLKLKFALKAAILLGFFVRKQKRNGFLKTEYGPKLAPTIKPCF